jgi:hypothetical protein
MNIRSNLNFPRPRIAALVLASSILTIGTSAADAQWFRWPSWDSAMRPMQVERMIEASGYRLTGPVLRDGPVYLANVLGRQNDPERLVIDARDGRLLQRYAAADDRQTAMAGDDWSGPPRPRPFLSDDGLDGADEVAPPRPPAEIESPVASETIPLPPSRSQRTHALPDGQTARTDDASSPSNPYIIMAPSAAPPPAVEKPKPKPQARRKKPAEPTPIAQPALIDGKPAALGQPATNPQAAISPDAATPTPRSDAPADPAASAPRVADTKTVATPTPTPDAAPVAPAAAVAPSKPKPALNDVPVAPLE